MLYRIVTVIGALVFVVILYGLIWGFSRWFLKHHGIYDQVSDRATVLATWTFAGVSVGLAMVVMGAFVLGPWAFYRTLRGHGVDVSDAAAVGWGLLIVVLSLGITAAGFFAFLMAVGAY
ncbi:hypothetical protein [Marinobacter sp. C2H3]|uniref:hypothetical protein n=1 Tax=Marinobacter sp. C2H3 TaxID=3119003 RepID=UPI00300F3A8D